MIDKEKIISLYYNDKLNTIEISKKLNVSKQYVSRILKTDDRYNSEKNERKNKNAILRKKKFNEYMNKKRKQKAFETQQINASLDLLHTQASIELSKRKKINNVALKKWNSSVYDYHYKSKEYRIKENMQDKVSYAIPKKIKWE